MEPKNILWQLRLERSAKEGRHITQREFAEWLGVPPYNYRHWEINRRQPSSIKHIRSICVRLGMGVEEIWPPDQDPQFTPDT